jgi:FHA domain/TIR domain
MASEIRIRMNRQDKSFAARAEVHIGRDPQHNEMSTENPLVSRRHALLHAEGGQWVIEDVGSRHGTFLNGTRVNRVPVDGTVTVWLGPPGRGQLIQVVPPSASEFAPSAVFISYRRGDGAGYAMVLHERLVAHFGPARVFRDLDTLGPGTNFVARIESAIGSCAVVIALIGTNWAGALPDGSRRLDDPDDFLRLELVSALQLGVRIIPVLVQGATMPRREELPEPVRALSSLQALRIDDSAVGFGVSQLITAVKRELGEASRPHDRPHDRLDDRPGSTDDTGPATVPTGGSKRSSVGWGWWLLPIFLGILGGVIAWGAVRERDRDRAQWLLIAGIISTVIWLGLAGGG